jgi:hypothetical protein
MWVPFTKHVGEPNPPRAMHSSVFACIRPRAGVRAQQRAADDYRRDAKAHAPTGDGRAAHADSP